MKYDHEYFKGKTAIVTGGASGIGLALLNELLQSGAKKVVMADINQGRLDEEGTKLETQFPGKVKTIQCNVASEENVRQMVDEAVTFFVGELDLLFNNAGIGAGGAFCDSSNDDWKTAFDINFFGALYGMRATLPIMEKQGSGQIINTISGIAFLPMAYQTCYAATKAALNALTLAMRSEYWDAGIKISAATPGIVATHIFDDYGTPEKSQSPQMAASRMLDGVVKNERIIFGSDDDVNAASDSFNPAAASQQHMDEYLLHIARKRRSGSTVAF